MTALSANPTVRRREEAFLAQARLEALDAKLDKLVVDMTKEVAAKPSLPTPDAFEVQCLSESLGEDDSWLPKGSVVNKLTELWNDRYLTVASSVSIEMLGTFTPEQLLSTGLIAHGKWQHHVHDRMLRGTPGVVAGRLIGPREVLLNRQRAGQLARPWLWSTE